MDAMTPGLAGQKGLRGEILLELKRAQPIAAKELGERFKVSSNAIRRHLLELENGGLVEHAREQRGAGAPTFAFKLSDAGEALFPNQYESALKRLLNHVVETEGRDAAAGILGQQYEELKRTLGTSLNDLSPVDRLKAVAGVMQGAGFMAELTESTGEAKLTIHNCAIHAAAECVPEVCDTELDFLRTVVNAPIERGDHIIDGCNSCEYALRAVSDAPTTS
jgi:DeoR family suf operon transcriptional repressor